MEFRVLGPIEASSGGRPLQLGGRQLHALLAFLLLHANEVVSADRLLDELWAVPPGGGVAAVRTQVSRLRKHLGDAISSSGRGYVLRVQPGELDLERFQALLAEAGATPDPDHRSALLREADRLWRGEALGGLDAPFVAVEAAALEELRLAAVEDRLEADLERGLDGELVAELFALVARYPLRERLRGQLILALYRNGRQADALDAYRETRAMLDEQLGLEPSPALRELERAILRHDPALAPVRPVAAAAVASDPERPRRRRRRAVSALALAALGAGSAATIVALGGHSRRPRLHLAAVAHPSAPAQPPAKAKPRVRRHAAKPSAARVTTTRITRATTVVVETIAAAPAKPVKPVVTTTTATHPAPTPRRTSKPATPKPVTILDGFDGGYVDPTIWHEIEDGGDVSIAEQGGQLLLTVGPGAIPGGSYHQIDVHVGTQCSFPSDFDARVDYALLEWPAGDNIDVDLNAIYANAAVMRESSSQWGDEYGSWVIPSNGSVALPDTSGSLRIARVDGIETTYFWHQGSWRKLASSRAAGAAVFGLQAMSDGQNAFGGQEVKVAFDNFKVRGVNPVCAPGSQP
jgi:DNA-binding SARP family transcriptional activator